MKIFISFFAELPIVAMLLTACNSIDNADLSMGSIGERQRTVQNHDVNVSLTEANGIADRFVNTYAGSTGLPTKSDDSRSNLISTAETIREDGQDLMYVFNYEDGGFVIVGSTRNYYPILAYSDKGSFVLQEDMGPVDVWLDETKVCIKNSSSLNAETKAEMQQLWARYDGTCQEPSYSEFAARRPQTRSTGEEACWERCETLQAQYGDEGWTFFPLSVVEDVFTSFGLGSYYDDICYSAYQNNSALNETVIGYKTPVVSQVGPIIGTEWHQESPFNNLCPNDYFAGCATVAAAQVLKYHLFPTNMSWGGVNFTWSDIPDEPDSTTMHPYLIMMLAQKFQITYSPPNGSGTFSQNIADGLDSLGFIVSMDVITDSNPFNPITVKNKLFNYRPVIMCGDRIDASTSQYKGHTWVCEGARETIYDAIQFYTENQPYGNGSFTQGMYTYNTPGVVGGSIFYYHFYMNWGVPPGSNLNGWFASNDVNVAGHNYKYNRRNIYVSTPYNQQ